MSPRLVVVRLNWVALPTRFRCLLRSRLDYARKIIVPLLELVKRVGVVNAVGYMNRCRNSVRLAKKVLSGRKVLGISCAWVGKKYLVPWWIDKDLSGGPFNEQATHVWNFVDFW